MHFRSRFDTEIAGTRELVTANPYIIVYETDGGMVTILRVWHGAQLRN